MSDNGSKMDCLDATVTWLKGQYPCDFMTILKPIIPPNLIASNNECQPSSTSTVPPVTALTGVTSQKFSIVCPHCASLIDSNLDKIDEDNLKDLCLDPFLLRLGLGHLRDLFAKEEITFDVLYDLGHEELKDIGVKAYGSRHKLIKAVQSLYQFIARRRSGNNSSSSDE